MLHMGFRLVPKSVTLNNLRHNGYVVCIISLNLLALGVYYIKVVEGTQVHPMSEM